MKHSKIVKLEKIIMFTAPSKDDEGRRFLPYCLLGWHQGVLRAEHYKLCENRGCKHFEKLYIPPYR
jgi:hypothetical protein